MIMSWPIDHAGTIQLRFACIRSDCSHGGTWYWNGNILIRRSKTTFIQLNYWHEKKWNIAHQPLLSSCQSSLMCSFHSPRSTAREPTSMQMKVDDGRWTAKKINWCALTCRRCLWVWTQTLLVVRPLLCSHCESCCCSSRTLRLLSGFFRLMWKMIWSLFSSCCRISSVLNSTLWFRYSWSIGKKKNKSKSFYFSQMNKCRNVVSVFPECVHCRGWCCIT